MEVRGALSRRNTVHFLFYGIITEMARVLLILIGVFLQNCNYLIEIPSWFHVLSILQDCVNSIQSLTGTDLIQKLALKC